METEAADALTSATGIIMIVANRRCLGCPDECYAAWAVVWGRIKSGLVKSGKTAIYQLFWRRGWDSNPRYGY